MNDTSWHSYPKIYALGHAYLAELLYDEVIVEEKIDGSQFSFGRFDGELRLRSRGEAFQPEAPQQMFRKAVDAVLPLDLHDGWTYRGEYLAKPKHNSLPYSRIPLQHVMLFDINDGHESYLSADAKRAEAERLGFECVPTFHAGRIESAEQIREFLGRESVLGGAQIEGVVVKNYRRFGADGKALMGKFVSEAFKERHAVEWKKANPGKGDVVEALIAALRSEARWAKALQHMRERGELLGDPKDIGPALKEINMDVLAECGDEIRERLFKWVWPQISRAITRGFPEWYKQQLLDAQFDKREDCEI